MKKIIITTIAIFFTTTITLTAQIRVATNNNVGIGYDIPQEKLHINGAIKGNLTGGALRLKTNYGYIDMGPINASFATFSTDRPVFYINKGLNIGDGRITSYTGYDLKLCVSSNFTTRITLLSSNSYVGILYTNPQYTLDVAGPVRAPQYLTLSDKRLKTNIGNLNYSALDKIMKLNAKMYDERINFELLDSEFSNSVLSDSLTIEAMGELKDVQMSVGLIAQDVKDVFSDLVKEDKNGYLSIDYIGLIPVLVEAIKEQQVKIQELQAQVAKLSGTKPK